MRIKESCQLYQTGIFILSFNHIAIQQHWHIICMTVNVSFFSEGKKELFEGNCTTEPVGDLKKKLA